MSDIERTLTRMGVGSNDNSWEWFDVDEASAPERDVDPETARKHIDDPEWLREQYVDEGRSARDIADEIGVPHKAVLPQLHAHDIPVRESTGGPRGDNTLPSRRQLRRLFVNEGVSPDEIADECGCDEGKVVKLLVLYRIADAGDLDVE